MATGAGSWLGQFVGWICVLFGIILFLISLLSFWVYMMDTDSMEGICDTDNIIVEAATAEECAELREEASTAFVIAIALAFLGILTIILGVSVVWSSSSGPPPPEQPPPGYYPPNYYPPPSPNQTAGLSDAEIEALLNQLDAARDSKEWAEADRIRDELKEQGIDVQDTPDGVRWRRV